MIPRIIMYIIVSSGIIAAAWWGATDDAAQRSVSHNVLTRVVPITLEDQPVYPTNHAVIALDPTQEYTWQNITLPETWPLGQYYIELWGANNRPIPGFAAQKLTSHQLDINQIDASLNPALRVVVFQPAGIAPLPPDFAVYINYAEQPNTRLFILVALAVLMYWTIGCWLGQHWQELKHYPAAVRQLLHGRLISALWAAVTTILFAGLFGLVLGSFIGGIQLLYVLIKIPLLMVTALLISFSTLVMLSWLSGVQAGARQLWTVALNLLAITALGLAAFCSILEFYVLYPLNHDQVLIAAVAFFVGSGMLAVVSLYRWLRQFKLAWIKRGVVPLIWVIIYGLVFLQLGWMLRPWVGVLDPVHNTVPFARPYSGNVFAELTHTLQRLDGS